MVRTTHSAPRRYSPLIGLGLLVTGCVAFLVIVLVLRDAIDPLRRAEAWEAYARRQRIDEELSTLDTAVAAGWRLLPLVLVAGAGGVGLIAFYHRLAARRFVEADKLIALQRAQAQRFPAGLQSLSFHDSSRHEPPALPEPVEVEQAQALTLPDTIALSTILPTLAPGKLCYGVLPGGDPLILTFGQAYHALAAGDTRTGKSNYLDATIVQLHHQAARYKLRLLIGDFKREMAATWRRSSLVETVETDPAVIADMLLSLAHDKDGILARYSEFERVGNERNHVIRNIADWARVTQEPPRLTFCVIDELNALIEAAEKRKELSSALKIVLQTGAGAGVYVLGGAQYLTDKVFGRDGSKQFTTRALFGAFDGTAARMVFGAGKIADDQRALLTGAPGRGLIRTAGQALPTSFQALRCGEEDILEAVKTTTLVEPRKASASGATTIAMLREAPSMGEKAELVKRLRALGVGKVKIIRAVWNVEPGGGSGPYQRASAEYEAIVGERA